MFRFRLDPYRISDSLLLYPFLYLVVKKRKSCYQVSSSIRVRKDEKRRTRVPLKLLRICLYCLLAQSLVMTGCRRISAPERAARHFLSLLETNDKQNAWKMLASTSQKKWSKAAKQIPHQTGKQLFLAGNLFSRQRLRRDFKVRPKSIRGDVYIAYKDELGRRIQLCLKQEQGRWKIKLEGRFNILSPTAPIPTRKTVTHTATQPTTRRSEP